MGSSRRVPVGLAEHLLHPAQPVPCATWDAMIATADLCGVPVAAVAEEDCIVDPMGFVVVRADRLSGVCRLSEDLTTAVTGLIEAAELAYLIQIGVSLVVRTNNRITAPPLTVAVPESDSAVAVAAELLAGAATGWLRLFTLSAPSKDIREPVYEPAAWTCAVPESAEQGIRLAVLVRLYEALTSVSTPALDLDAASITRRLTELRIAAGRMTSEVYEVAARLPLMASDLLVTMFPGPQQFAKYRGGAGAGQSQWPPPRTD